MSKQIPHEIIDRASEWFIELRETDLSDTVREAFSEWLRASPAHVQAYLEVASVWGDASQVSKELTVEFAGEATNVVALETGNFSGAPASSTVPRARVPKRAYFAIAAALILTIASAGGWWQFTRLPTYSADIGEQRVITLDDGSVIRLNSRSKVRVSITPQQRNVELLAGQALFQVAKDHTRPFIVRSGDIDVRAVGTQFDVYRRRTGTTVTVVEGRVAVLPVGMQSSDARVLAAPSANSTIEAVPSSGSAQVLAAGQQATVTPTGIVQVHLQANIAAATGWLQQELIFTDEPLSVVIDEFNRYSRRTILLDDPSLAQFKINAVFNTTNPQSFLRFLSRMEGVRVDATEREIHITRREPHQ